MTVAQTDASNFEFIPAQSMSEAVSRIFSLTGATPREATRGEKRAIVALRDALGLDIATARTSTVMAGHIANSLGVRWDSAYATRNRITLQGMNVLLEGSSEAWARGSLDRLAELRPPELDSPTWAGFSPARSKIEAVNRISNLTHSGPEVLGPGSKERKSVLVNLARGLHLDVDVSLTKTKLGRAIAEATRAPWTDHCESTGETVSLIGLNVLLAGAERYLGASARDRLDLTGTPEQEGAALVAALVDAWRTERQSDGRRRVVWDGRSSIRWMREQGVSEGPNQNEWQGFYWESRGKAVLNAAFTPAADPRRMKYGKTAFDYSLNYVWDLKAHTEGWRSPSTGVVTPSRSQAPLNDQVAMNECVSEQGLGFLVVGGVAVADEDEAFVTWHRSEKARYGVRSVRSNSGRSRLRKSAFEPTHVEAFFFHDIDALNAAKATGLVGGFAQGKQAPRTGDSIGATRRAKYSLKIERARDSSTRVADQYWAGT